MWRREGCPQGKRSWALPWSGGSGVPAGTPRCHGRLRQEMRPTRGVSAGPSGVGSAWEGLRAVGAILGSGLLPHRGRAAREVPGLPLLRPAAPRALPPPPGPARPRRPSPSMSRQHPGPAAGPAPGPAPGSAADPLRPPDPAAPLSPARPEPLVPGAAAAAAAGAARPGGGREEGPHGEQTKGWDRSLLGRENGDRTRTERGGRGAEERATGAPGSVPWAGAGEGQEGTGRGRTSRDSAGRDRHRARPCPPVLRWSRRTPEDPPPAAPARLGHRGRCRVRWRCPAGPSTLTLVPLRPQRCWSPSAPPWTR